MVPLHGSALVRLLKMASGATNVRGLSMKACHEAC